MIAFSFLEIYAVILRKYPKNIKLMNEIKQKQYLYLWTNCYKHIYVNCSISFYCLLLSNFINRTNRYLLFHKNFMFQFCWFLKPWIYSTKKKKCYVLLRGAKTKHSTPCIFWKSIISKNFISVFLCCTIRNYCYSKIFLNKKCELKSSKTLF